jgi:type 1 fimbriae regulatory protein FimB/type 1 fimbriae regulatory protein FimE
MGNSHLKLVVPTTVNRAVTPRRRANAAYREREHLTPTEVERLLNGTKDNRQAHRDRTMIEVAYRHGLRAAEVCSLKWSEVDLAGSLLHVRRLKGSAPSTHPIRGDEIRALRRLHREAKPSSFVFTSERGGPFTPHGFAYMVSRAGITAGFKYKVHPHQLRHACGYALANDGHDARHIAAYLGHRNLNNVTRYTALSTKAFDNFWR